AKAVDSIAERCESVEGLAEQTRALKPELEQRHHAVAEAAKELNKAHNLRKEAASSAQQLEELTKKLHGALGTADKRGAMKERLARAEAVLVDVRTSLEALQGQKAIVDQAVEKAGSLQFLLKQADAVMDGLRGERDMTARVQAAMSVVRGEDEADEEEDDEPR